MYPFNLKQTNEMNYTALPAAVVGRIRPWLDRNLTYEVVPYDKVPDGVPQGCIFRGRPYLYGYVFIRAAVRPEDLVSAAEDMHRMAREDL